MIDLIAIWIGRVLMVCGGVGLAGIGIAFVLCAPIERAFRKIKLTMGAKPAVDALRVLLEKKKGGE